jgi:dienelactone hydrolase
MPPVGTLGTYRVGARYLVLTEVSAGLAGRRILHVAVRYPIVPGTFDHQSHGRGFFPLIVFAPGFRQCAHSYHDLLAEWASAGYVVAAVDFPLTSCKTPAPDEADLVHQPADLEYVIRHVISLSRNPLSTLAGLVNPARIGLAGHSDGGDTVAAMAGSTCCRSYGIGAVAVLSGAEWPAMPGRWFVRPAPPMLFVQGTADTWNFPAASLQLYHADTTGPRFYLDLFGADHFAPYQGDGQPEPLVARVTTDFFDYYLAGERSRGPAMLRAGTARGVAELVRNGQPA